MKKNLKLAKRLVKLAKCILSKSDFTDPLGEDPNGSTYDNNAEYQNIVMSLYPRSTAENILWNDEGAMAFFTQNLGGKAQTMGNGNLYMPYVIIPRMKKIIILGIVSKKGHLTLDDLDDLNALGESLHKKIIEGYEVESDCNQSSITFFHKMCKKYKDLKLQQSEEYNPFGDTGHPGETWRRSILTKK